MLGTVLGVLYLSHLGLTSLLRVSKPGLREAGTHGRPPAGQAQLRQPVCLAPTWGPHMPFQVHSLCMSVSGVVVDSTHFTLRTVLVWTIHYLGTFSCSLCHLQLLPKLPPPDFTTLDATKSKTFEFLNLPKRWKQ